MEAEFSLVFGLLANANYYAFQTTLVQDKEKHFLSVSNWLVLNSSFPDSLLKKGCPLKSIAPG